MIDLPALQDGLAMFKSGMDGLRTAFGVWKDIRGSIPADRRTEIDRAIELSEAQLKLAEAQIAKGLGYRLCHCSFPPTPMLTVGWRSVRTNDPAGEPVHQCPKCNLDDAGPWVWTKTADRPR